LFYRSLLVRFMLIFPALECPRAPQAAGLAGRFTLLAGTESSDRTTRLRCNSHQREPPHLQQPRSYLA
jgi:hypothetical protein